jgi:hypothetical protein
MLQYTACSIRKHEYIQRAIFSRIAKLLGQYGESTLPILISRKDNTGVVIENVCIVTRVTIYRIYNEI